MSASTSLSSNINKPPSPCLADPAFKGVLAELQENGIVSLPILMSHEQLRGMKAAFESRLQRVRWNNFEGYEKTEPYRHMIEDVLVLDQGFVNIALHPLVKAVAKAYVGNRVQLTEARGWKSLPTKRDFHGWHGDEWYDQTDMQEIPRELKLAIYLTDVRSGAFNYRCGSHRKHHPRLVPNTEMEQFESFPLVEMLGPAGTAFMFDTSGVHRQGVPMLEPREAVFFNYHDRTIQLQEADRKFHRYHPLLLNAAFLGDLTDDDQEFLGFGDKSRFIPGYTRPAKPPFLYDAFQTALNLQLRAQSIRERIRSRFFRK